MADISNSLVSIIIVTAGAKDYVLSCLDSVKKQSYPSVETIVIDNSSCLALQSRILREFPFVRIYPGPEELSYGEALNLGIEKSKGEHVLCLNDDVILSKDFIQNGLEGFNLNNRIGIVSGKVLRFEGRLIDSAGLFLTLWLTAGERGYGKINRGQFEKAGYIFGATGAVAFYRRSMLEEIKAGQDYFDPDFRFFYEDLDVSWRANNSGWKGYYLPSALAYHLRGGTVRMERMGISKKYARLYLNDELYFELVKNRYLAIAKNEKLTDFLFRLPLVIFYEIVVWVLIIFSRPKLLSRFFAASFHLSSRLKRSSPEGHV
ncbi:MAG: glycosyltransferase family 2 protein [Candidatus Omnitrophota bacterium]|jgi:GT2 family glycosyltransferase